VFDLYLYLLEKPEQSNDVQTPYSHAGTSSIGPHFTSYHATVTVFVTMRP